MRPNNYFNHLARLYVFFLFSSLFKVLEATTDIQFTYSSNVSIPGTSNPTEYYVGDGRSLTLECSYTNTLDNGIDVSLVIVRVLSSDTAQRTNLVTYTLYEDGRTPTAVCTSNWANVCETHFDESDDRFAGSLSVSHSSYDGSVETGEFECRLDLFNEAHFETLDITGN